VAGIRELHKLLNVTKDFSKPDELLTSYDIAHHAGLSLEEEYEVLQLLHEMQSLEYLKAPSYQSITRSSRNGEPERKDPAEWAL
jgi:hypothetical protein